jgi:ribulose-phosphate 3-epimerase
MQQLRPLNAEADLAVPIEHFATPQVIPSILAADFGRLREQVGEVLAAGARIIHVDVMDGHFVEPISMGTPVISALQEQVEGAGAILDVHLMVERPERLVGELARAGGHSFTVHVEATPQLGLAIERIRSAGLGVGVAVNPATPAAAVGEVVAEVDLCLCMTVNPGWGGQPFLPGSPQKVRRLRGVVGPNLPIEVDGGIDPRTAPLCAAAGATLFVAGAAIFSHKEPGEAFQELTAAISVPPTPAA